MRTHRRAQACRASSPLAIDRVNRIVLGDRLKEKGLGTAVEQRGCKALTTSWKSASEEEKDPNVCGTRKSLIAWLQKSGYLLF